MNQIKRRQIVIDYYVWEPMLKVVQKEEDEILHMVHEKKLLAHAGYAKARFEGEK